MSIEGYNDEENYYPVSTRTQAASVDETLDISTLDLLREIEQRVQKIHRTAELYANDEITAHETVKQIATIKTLLNQAIVKELSK